MRFNSLFLFVFFSLVCSTLATAAFVNKPPSQFDAYGLDFELSPLNREVFVPFPDKDEWTVFGRTVKISPNYEIPASYPGFLSGHYPSCIRVIPSATGATITYNPLCQYCGLFPLTFFDAIHPDKHIDIAVAISCQADLVVAATADTSVEVDSGVRSFIDKEAQRGNVVRYVKLGGPHSELDTVYAPGAINANLNKLLPSSQQMMYFYGTQEAVALTDARSLLIISNDIPKKEFSYYGWPGLITDDFYGTKPVLGKNGKYVDTFIPVSRLEGTDSQIATTLSNIGISSDDADSYPIEVAYSSASEFPLVNETGQAVEIPDVEFPLKLDPIGITSSYGPRLNPLTLEFQNHRALDLSTVVGTPVYAPLDGTVSLVTDQPNCGTGVILISGEFKFGFCHLSEVVKTGQVKKGDLFAKTGNTGLSSGPHLHVTTRFNGNEFDPLVLFLNAPHPMHVNPQGQLTLTIPSRQASSNEANRKRDDLLYGEVLAKCARDNNIPPALLWQFTVNKLTTGQGFNCATDRNVALLKNAAISISPTTTLTNISGSQVLFQGKYVAQPFYRLRQSSAGASASKLYIFKASSKDKLAQLEELTISKGTIAVIAHGPVTLTPPLLPLSSKGEPLTAGELLSISKQEIKDSTRTDGPRNLGILQAMAVSMQGNPLYAVKIT